MMALLAHTCAKAWTEERRSVSFEVNRDNWARGKTWDMLGIIGMVVMQAWYPSFNRPLYMRVPFFRLLHNSWRLCFVLGTGPHLCKLLELWEVFSQWCEPGFQHVTTWVCLLININDYQRNWIQWYIDQMFLCETQLCNFESNAVSSGLNYLVQLVWQTTVSTDLNWRAGGMYS